MNDTNSDATAQTDDYGTGVLQHDRGQVIRGDPLLPCHECGAEEQFMAMKRSKDWSMEYLDDGTGEWIAYCPECDSDD